MTTHFRSTLFLALRRAGKLIRRHFDKSNKVQFKNNSPINLVTWVDQASDRLIRETIRKRFPDHDFLTEESEPTQKHAAYKWIIDPLDGTTNFAHHFPQCCVSIALEFNPHPQPLSQTGRGANNPAFSHPVGTPLPVRERVRSPRRPGVRVILAGVYDPFRDELFWAERGRGAFLKTGELTRRLRVSATPKLTQSLLLTGFPYDRRERADFYLAYVRAFLEHIQGIRRAGAAALDLCWVAAGRVDGYWEWRLKPWDVAAGQLIVTEAGGRVSDFSGGPLDIYGEQTLASNGAIHGEMLRVMKGVRRK